VFWDEEGQEGVGAHPRRCDPVKACPHRSRQKGVTTRVEGSSSQALLSSESTGEDGDDPRQDQLPSAADRPTDLRVGDAIPPELSAG